MDRKQPQLSVARQLITDRICPWEVIGDVSYHERESEWRALVALTPSGPLLLMGFKIQPVEDTMDREQRISSPNVV